MRKVLLIDAAALNKQLESSQVSSHPTVLLAVGVIAKAMKRSTISIPVLDEPPSAAAGVVDDNPEIGRPIYGHGQVFENDDGRLGILLSVMAGERYIFLESTREVFPLVHAARAPARLTLDVIVGARDVGRWHPTDREFQTAPFAGDAYGPET